MREIADDPIVRSLERSGYPPWFRQGDTDFEERDWNRGEDSDGKL